jgi:hypothetical protein
MNIKSLKLVLASSQYAYNATPSAAIQITGDLTIECDVMFTTVASDNVQFVTLRTPSDNKAAYQFYHDGASHTLNFFHRNAANENDGPSTAWTPALNTWYHLAVTISSTTLKFWVDGVQLGVDKTLTKTRGFVAGSYLYIGSLDGTGQYINGFIDDVRIWNVSRSGANLLANKEVELAGTESGLEGYWKFNDNLLDSTASGNNLTGSGSPTYSTSLPFDDMTGRYTPHFRGGSANNLIEVTHYTAIDISSGTISIEAYIRRDETTNRVVFLTRQATDDSNNMYSLITRASPNNNKLCFYYNSGTGSTEQMWVTTNDVFTAGVWVHCAITFTYGTGSGIKCYIDGVDTAGSWTLGNGNANATASTQHLRFGASGTTSPTYLFKGSMAEVRIWNTIRTQAQVQANKDLHLVGNESGLVGYWKLQDASGTSAANLVSGGNAGTLTNFTSGSEWSTNFPKLLVDVVAQTILGLASVAIVTAKTITGLARLTIYTARTIQGLGRITINTTRTILGKSRITAGALKTITGVSKVTATTARTILGKAALAIPATQTILGKSDIGVTTLQTIVGISTILSGVQQRTITGLARIGLVSSKTIQGLARITITTAAPILGLARITAGTLKTILGLARIKITTLQTILGQSRIGLVSSKTIQGLSRITISTTKTILGKSSVLGAVVKTIAGKSSIIYAGLRTILGRSSIATVTRKDITGISRIKVYGAWANKYSSEGTNWVDLYADEETKWDPNPDYV